MGTSLSSAPLGRTLLKRDLTCLAKGRPLFLERYPDFGPFFHSAVNTDFTLFRDGLLYFIDVSKSFEDQVSAL